MEPPKKAIKPSPYTVYVGVAAEDIEQDSQLLKIICPELLPNSSYGTVGAGITEGTVKLQNRDGATISSSITTANHLVATWEGQSNLKYPPMIRKGESVEVFKLNNQDKYYWRTSGRGSAFRATDRVYIEIGATDPKKPGVDKDDTNSYSAYLDSENKKVGFKTSKANGEVAAFAMEADLKAGIFRLSDDTKEPGNRFFLDTGVETGKPIFQINLVNGTTLKMEGDDMYIKVPKNLQIDVGDRFLINSPLTIFNLAKKGAIIVNAASVAFNAAKDFVVDVGGVIGLNGPTKVSGVLAAASAKFANAVKTAVSGSYKATSISRPEDGPVKEASNQPDVNMAGLPYRAP